VIVGDPLPALDSGPAAIGYVCPVRVQRAEMLGWSWAIAGYCLAKGLALHYVFGDTGMSPDGGQVGRAWRLLLGHLGDVACMTVLVPSLEDLGVDPAVRARMCAQVTAAGALVQPLMPLEA